MGRPPGIALFSHVVDPHPRSIRLRATKRTVPPGPAPARRRRLVQLTLVFGGCVLLLDAFVGEKGLVDMIRARQEHQTLERALATARRENDRLREEIRRLEEDPAAIEDLARRELGLIKPGEKLFTIRDIAPRIEPKAPSEPAP